MVIVWQTARRACDVLLKELANIFETFGKLPELIHHGSFWPEEIGKRRKVLDDRYNKVMEWEFAREAYTVQLELLCGRGVKLFVDGRAALPGEAAARTVRENSPYMADYVLGDEGNIEQVRFDRVTCC